MKVALVTTPLSVRSGIGDYTRHLLPYLREHCDVELFVQPEYAGPDTDGEPLRSVTDLKPKRYDQVQYQLGNERYHAFMLPMIRAIGGTVMQHDWVLFDLAVAAYPGLLRGGLKGHALAMREGGRAQLMTYLRSWRERRARRLEPGRSPELDGVEGELLWGWHAPQADGCWTADEAFLRLPSASSLRLTISADPRCQVRVSCEGVECGQFPQGGGELVLALPQGDSPLLSILTAGLTVTPDQRKHGDIRRLGAFVRELAYQDASGWHAVDLQQPVQLPLREVELSDFRFQLPFNRSVVRFADAFLVHSDYVKQHILRERNSLTPVGVLPHGAERRWHEEPRNETRSRLQLGDDWQDAFVVTSFGGVQAHKRVDRLMHAVARAREQRADIRLLMAGGYHRQDFDPEATARRLGIADAVRVLGWVEEPVAWDCIHAGDVCVNLRGPTSGGTSGGIYQSLAFARPVIATDAGEQVELPDDCILKVPLGEGGDEGEIDALTRILIHLRDEPEVRARLETAARGYVENVCHWSHSAALYAEYMASFPAARAARKSLIALARERGKERDRAAS